MEEERCVICLEEITSTQKCGLLRDGKKACSHVYHRDCVVAWGKAAYSADKRPVSTSRSRRKPLPKCPTCRAEFGAFIMQESGKTIDLVTIMLPKSSSRTALANFCEDEDDDEEEDEEEDDDDDDTADDDDDSQQQEVLLAAFQQHYIQREQTNWLVADNSAAHQRSRGSNVNVDGRGRHAAAATGRTSSTATTTMSGQMEESMSRGAAFVAQCIADARRRSAEIDTILLSSSPPQPPPRDAQGNSKGYNNRDREQTDGNSSFPGQRAGTETGTASAKATVGGSSSSSKKKGRRLNSSLASEVAASLSKQQQQEQQEQQQIYPSSSTAAVDLKRSSDADAPVPVSSAESELPSSSSVVPPRVKRRKISSGTMKQSHHSALLSVLPPLR
jgi:hypothetical protein